MARILVSDKISEEGLEILRAGGFEVSVRPDITDEQIAAEIAEYDALVIRSRTTVTPDIIRNAHKLRVIGRAGVGVDNVDVAAATKRGIVVMNTPDGNTISTAEHSFAMLMALARSIPQADRSMHDGKWDKKKYVGVELYGKTLGVVGLGRIGATVARRALGFEMRVLAYDPYMSADALKRLGITQASVDEICEQADFITVHTPLNDATRGIIGAEQFAKMKKTARVVNCARGGIIDEAALLEALQSGRIAGAGLDVFAAEPLPADSPFRSIENVVLTPHLGAATSEAQEGVARDVAVQIVDMLKGGTIRNAVNTPSVDPALLEQVRPYLELAQKTAKFLSQMTTKQVKEVRVYYSGAVLDYPVAPITTAAVVGFLDHVTEGSVNFVNAPLIAQERGIAIVEERSSKMYDFSTLVTLEAIAEDGSSNYVGATLVHQRTPRIVMVNDKFFDVVPEGLMIVIENRDVPGIIGGVATLLGEHKINIAQMTWGRTGPGEDALTVMNVDQEVSPDLLEKLGALPNIISARLIRV